MEEQAAARLILLLSRDHDPVVSKNHIADAHIGICAKHVRVADKIGKPILN